MRAIGGLFVLGALAPFPRAAAQSEDPTFKTTARLVEVSVVARDRKGQAVTDLKREDFSILGNGKPRPIAFFHFDGEPPGPPVPPLTAGLFTNRVEYTPGPARNVVALLLDSLNTAPEDQARVRAEVRRYLRELPPDTRVAVYLLGARLTILHDFTDDGESLRARLQQAPLELPTRATLDVNQRINEAERWMEMIGANASNPPAGLVDFVKQSAAGDTRANEEARANRTAWTLSALDALGRHLAGIPGRKSLVWIGSGIASLSIYGGGIDRGGGVTSYEDAIRAASQRVAQQGVALYVVDARGISMPMEAIAPRPETSSRAGRSRAFDREREGEKASADTRPAMFEMAHITGGRVFATGNDMAAGLRQASADAHGSYTLSFYAEGELDGRWRALKVHVARPGVSVLHREGYLATPAAPRAAAWSDEQWRTAILSPLCPSGILINARAMQGREPGTLWLDLEIEPNNVHFRKSGARLQASLELCVAETNAEGKVSFHKETANLSLSESDWKDTQKVGIPYRRVWKPGARLEKVRVIVRDKSTGQLGALDLPVSKIPPFSGV